LAIKVPAACDKKFDDLLHTAINSLLNS
jgi:hypothetical protein